MAEVEIGGATIKGGKLMLLIPLLGTLGGGAWAGFEIYKDYTDMKEIVQEMRLSTRETSKTIYGMTCSS